MTMNENFGGIYTMKKMAVALMGALMITSSIPGTVYANETYADTSSSIDTLKVFKAEVAIANADGELSASEKVYLEENSEDAVIEEFITEKMDLAVDILNDSENEGAVYHLEEGQAYKKEVYDLGDSCQLIVELEDRSEDDEELVSRATSGSNTLWKEYGNRYFTASATVNFSLGYATMKLRNHYTLSAKGIDERYGTPEYVYYVDDGAMSVTKAKITDSTARTVGASDVNMECEFTFHYPAEDGYTVEKEYLMESTVGFVDIDKSAEKVKVKQSWKLTRLS